MQYFSKLPLAQMGAFSRATSDRANLAGAVIRLVAVFACAATVQVLAGSFLG